MRFFFLWIDACQPVRDFIFIRSACDMRPAEDQSSFGILGLVCELKLRPLLPDFSPVVTHPSANRQDLFQFPVSFLVGSSQCEAWTGLQGRLAELTNVKRVGLFFRNGSNGYQPSVTPYGRSIPKRTPMVSNVPNHADQQMRAAAEIIPQPQVN
jgi:hypothetical protein